MRSVCWLVVLAVGLPGCVTHRSTVHADEARATGAAAVGEPIAVETLLKAQTSWDGEALPAYPEGMPEVTLLRITIAPGVALPEHRHPVINAGILLEGELKVTTEDGDETTLSAGDTLAEVVDEWHFGRNVGDTPVVILVFYVGTEGVPLTIRRSDATGGPHPGGW